MVAPAPTKAAVAAPPSASVPPYCETQGESARGSGRSQRARRLVASEAAKEALPLSVGAAAAFVSKFFGRAVMRLLGKLLDENKAHWARISDGTSRDSPPPLVLGDTAASLLFVVIGSSATSFLRSAAKSRAAESISFRLRTSTFADLLLRRDVEWFGGIPPAAVGSVLAEDAAAVATAVSSAAAAAVPSACAAVAAAYGMFRVSPALAAASLAAVPAFGAGGSALRHRRSDAAGRGRDAATEAASFAEERIERIELVRSADRARDEAEAYCVLQRRVVDLGRAAAVADGVFAGFTVVASSAALLFIAACAGREVAKGRLTEEDLMTFSKCTLLLGHGTFGVLRAAADMVGGVVAAERLLNLTDGTVDEGAPMDAAEDGAIVSSPLTSELASISMEDVFFSYRSDPDRRILSGINLVLSPGKIVALVGKNGSGKSTIAGLLAGHYKLKEGEGRVAVDFVGEGRTDLHSIHGKNRIRLIQLVPQQPALLDNSVADNVSYADPLRRAGPALSAAGCDALLAALPGGTSYMVGRNGDRLSGGQRRRIGLARALHPDPAALILDEPTGGLDAEGEGALMDAVAARRAGGGRRAVLLVTHVKRYLRLADEVHVLRNGRIVESGGYEELSEREGGALRELFPDLL
eukprot:CAMPEP_0194309936 /NCGR_PEP_ID=MMETSP0171-20130528/6905_1 /TAXON_ID=218684 /ORGANISM="Corethron pennatum, Strain L29A3" /LENGTH=638 /DNA_ID=CAMNT_0039063331 /DNA_START=140 /DNA_END=2056 /DNA_ORIENTATION=-